MKYSKIKNFLPYHSYAPNLDSEKSAQDFYSIIKKRRSVRHFSKKYVRLSIIKSCIKTAGSAPSGANTQPWRFVAIKNKNLKHKIRLAAEKEELKFYKKRASQRWLEDLEPLGTTHKKLFLEEAPWIIVIFKLLKDDRKEKNNGQVYYPNESVGIASGLFLAACQMAGLATLTHTPSPMNFLGKILKRKKHERPFLLIPVGWPAQNCVIPNIKRKPDNELFEIIK
tara:strand:- start:226 stop:900 length:675 start_codon:yes stop_codon:yes gene_type:complete